ncbi:arylamine N-acetyltransferase [Prolixibacteraceae bacterium]|nr:arylamine N-acetyltransferase [Prolixibacteraceae bacterium]
MKTKDEIERMILNEFKTVPFHNIYFLYKKDVEFTEHGGTCSDKVINLYYKLKDKGIKVNLHSSIINRQECHRILRITIDSEIYFADIGNGWPSIYLFPASYSTTFSCYGITFRSEVTNNNLLIYQKRLNKESLSITIPTKPKSENEIWKDIQNRYKQNIRYPFQDSIRFAKIINEKFLFLRGDKLHIHSKNNYSQITIPDQSLKETLKIYFNTDLDLILTTDYTYAK